MTSSASPDPNTFYLIQPSGQTSNCIVSLPEGVPTTDYPLQVQPCNAAGDYAQWQIISDNAGAYFFYNRGFTGQSHRLDFVQPLGFPDILIMGPSNDTYHNQHWILNWASDKIVRFTSYGLDNAWLSVTQVNRTISGVILQSTADATSSDSSWNLNTAIESSSSITITATSAAELATSTTTSVVQVLQSLAASPSSASPSAAKISTTPSTSSPTSITTETASPTSTPAAASGLTTPGKVGLAVGIVISALIVGWLWWCIKRRRRRRTEALSTAAEPPSTAQKNHRNTLSLPMEAWGAQKEAPSHAPRPHEIGRVTSY
ncbi:hypothetical protein F5882DRAFT_525635 [Hyaloscypha sp. PMI_1271]|nr:hypothetical protein F5882DRAFT_525635 [Hyaloscypha sp. PMI_1271]